MSHTNEAALTQPASLPPFLEGAEDSAEFAGLYERGMPRTVYGLLQWTARVHGQKNAWRFIDDGISRNWAQVLEQVDRTADTLHRLGVRKGTHVAVMTSNIEAFPLCWLALAKLGATIAPVNIAYTSREVAHALTLSESRYLLIEDTFLPIYEELQDIGIPAENVLVVGEHNGPYRSWEAELAASKPAETAETVEPGTLLNIQFTSGTTGFAKGCMLTHEYWMVLGVASSLLFGDVMQRIYLGQSFYYMVGQRLLMNALLMGAELIIPRKPGSKRFMPDLITYECDYCSMFEMAYKQGLSLKEKKNVLKLATIFGFSATTAQHFESLFDTPVQEFYGMTEIGGALYLPRDIRPTDYESGTCGIPCAFREVGVFDLEGNPVPDGQAGELCVRGAGLMLGYYRNEEASREVFRNDWFRTGDLFVKDANGHFRIVGRIKDMVRRNGENIPAQEVEAVIRMLPEVRQAAVIPVPDDYCGEEVKVYLELNDGVSRDQLPMTRVLEHARANLAAFKVPRYYAYIDKFELTDSLRVRKKALTEGVADLRAGAWDAKDDCWHPAQEI